MSDDVVVSTITQADLDVWDYRNPAPPPIGTQIMRRPDGTHYIREPEEDERK